MLGARPFDRSLMTPINATDMQKCSSQHESHIPSTGVQLRTPSSFAVKGSYSKYPYDAQNKQDTATATNNNEILTSIEEYNCTPDNVSANSNIARSQPIERKMIYENFQRAHDFILVNEKGIDGKNVNSSNFTLAEQEIVPAREKHTSRNYVSYGDAFEGHREIPNDTTLCIAHRKPANEIAFNAESMLADALLPPSAIHVNDIIGSTLDEKGLTFIREKLADKYNIAENPAMYAVSKSFRPLDASDISYPRNGGAKENNNPASINKHADKTAIAAMNLLPAESLEERTEMSAPYEAERKRYKLQSQIVESTIVPAKINEQRRYGLLTNNKTAHNDPLVTDTSKAITKNTMDPHILMSKHNCTDLTFPTSNLSTQILDSQNPIDAKSNPLQVESSTSILQSSVIHSEQLQNQMFPYIIGSSHEQRVQYTQLTDCLKDAIEGLKIDSTKVHKCEKCHEDIRIGDVVVIAEKVNNASWHPGCFVCSVCNELLVDLVYFYYKSRLYCGRDLAAFLGIPRCFACDEVSNFSKSYLKW